MMAATVTIMETVETEAMEDPTNVLRDVPMDGLATESAMRPA